jgi:hypothetical protein
MRFQEIAICLAIILLALLLWHVGMGRWGVDVMPTCQEQCVIKAKKQINRGGSDGHR